MSKLDQMNMDFSVVSLEHMTMQPEEDGSYKVIVGAFNIWSGNGHFYELTEGVKALYEPGSALQKRIEAEDVFVEDGHPPYTPGMDVATYLESLLIKTESKICGKILSLKLDEKATFVKGHREPIYLVKARIIPYGPKKDILERSFKNPSSNTAFSVRGLNYAKRLGGLLYKEIHTLMTYDYVRSPGINIASKSAWDGLSLENLDIKLSKMDLVRLVDRLDARSEAATEAESIMINQIRDSITGCDDGNCIYKIW